MPTLRWMSSQSSQRCLAHLSCQPVRFLDRSGWEKGGEEDNNIPNLSQPRVCSCCTGCATIQIYDVAYDLNLFSHVGTRFDGLDVGSDSGIRSRCEMCTTYIKRNALVERFPRWFELLCNLPACPITITNPNGVL